MPGIDRTTIITGPALVQFGGQSFWSKGDVTLKPVFKRFAIETAAFGKVDERFSDRRFEVSFEPSGRFTTALAAVLWPYAAMAIGTSIFGATDDALVIHGRDGVKLTLHNAALTQMPNIRLGVDKTILGPCRFTALLAKDTDPTNAAAYYTTTAEAYPGDTGFAVGDIITKSPATSWGSSIPWNSFSTEAGWEISFNLRLSEQAVDGFGTIDMSLQGLDVSAKAVPVGPTVAQILAALKSNQSFGTSLAGDDLQLDTEISDVGVLTSASIWLSNAALVDSENRYGAQSKRIGTCEWVSTRSFTAGVPDPLFSITTA